MKKEEIIRLMYKHSETLKNGYDGDYEQLQAIPYYSFGDFAEELLETINKTT